MGHSTIAGAQCAEGEWLARAHIDGPEVYVAFLRQHKLDDIKIAARDAR